eukprot:4269277-Prymnesium_polylepis.1
MGLSGSRGVFVGAGGPLVPTCSALGVPSPRFHVAAKSAAVSGGGSEPPRKPTKSSMLNLARRARDMCERSAALFARVCVPYRRGGAAWRCGDMARRGAAWWCGAASQHSVATRRGGVAS